MSRPPRLALALAGLAALFAGTWALVTAFSPTSPLAEGGPSPRPVVLTTASDGRTTEVGVGGRVLVVLAGRGRMRWSEVGELPAGRFLAARGATRSPDGSTSARFVAVAPGRATLRATGGPICRSALPCPEYLVLWQAVVVVRTAAPSAVAPSREERQELRVSGSEG
ncbi:MAG TPA: hypothetical protein VKW77_00650 [Acidimicrobiales bacterium]|nr:hypothetical protein [Acidimicrobiales bacterium]